MSQVSSQFLRSVILRYEFRAISCQNDFVALEMLEVLFPKNAMFNVGKVFHLVDGIRVHGKWKLLAITLYKCFVVFTVNAHC